MTDRPPADDDRLEDVLARCLERIEREGPAAAERLLGEHPELEGPLRRHLQYLSTMGLLPVDSSPRRFGDRYRVERVLGSGGMGVVYLAIDERLERRVALKTCGRRDFAPLDERVRERFRREIQAVAQLQHPNIVPVYDVGDDGGVAFFAMEYVKGATLAELLTELKQGAVPAELDATSLSRAFCAVLERRGSVEEPATVGAWGRTYVESVCRIVREVADALAHVHRHGIVHRDVKPSNVLVDATGRARLFDLGLAHLDDELELTRTGDLAGSPYYASPEQVQARPRTLDGRTDVYSLGVTLFELLTMRVPFEGRTAAEVLRKIQISEPPLPRSLSPMVPRDLETICLTSLEKDRERRYASAADLASDLGRLLDLAPIHARPVSNARRAIRFLRRRPAIAAASLLALLVAVGTPIGLLVANHMIAEQRDHARRNADDFRRESERNREIKDFWESLILDLHHSSSDAARTGAGEVLRRGAARIDHEAAGSPGARATLLDTLGLVYSRMSRHAEALPFFDRAFAQGSAAWGDDSVELAQVRMHLASTHLALGDVATARVMAERALATFDLRPSLAEPAARCDVVLGDVALVDDDLDLAESHYRRALSRCEPQEPDTLSRLGLLALRRGRADEAERLLGESLDARRGRERPVLDAIAVDLRGLGELALARGDVVSAEELLEESLGLFRKTHGDVHPEVEATLKVLAAMPSNGDASDWPPSRHRRVGQRFLLLGENVTDPSLAAGWLERSIDHLERAGDAGDSSLGMALVRRAAALKELGEEAESIASIDRALSIGDRPGRASGPAERWWIDACAARARVALAEGDRAAAATWARRRVELLNSRADVTRRELVDAALRVAAAQRIPSVDGGALDWIDRALATLWEEEGSRALDSDRFALDDGYPALIGSDDRRRDYVHAFQRGITALQSHRHEEAIAAFEACLDVIPGVPICVYNIACVRAEAGDVDAALESLERAVRDGFGARERDLDLLQHDADLAPLRDHPRFDELVAEVRRSRAASAEFARAPAVHVPASLDASTPQAVCIVLHRHGATKEDVVAGPWRAVADELGMVLVAPSGRIQVAGGRGPEEGMTWVDDLDRYGQRYWQYEVPVREALRSVRDVCRVDGGRVFIAGEGLGGTLAFNVALRSPDLFRGVLLHDAAIHVGLASEKAAQLATMGLRAALVYGDEPVPGLERPEVGARYAAALTERLLDWGIEPVAPAAGGGRPPSARARLLAGMGALLRGD